MTVGFLIALGVGELGMITFSDRLPEAARFPTPEGEVKFNDLVVEGRDVEVVALGSSSLEAALDPRQLSSSMSAYNLAMPFTDLATMRVWLSEVVFERMRPEMVLIGLRQWEGADPVSIEDSTRRALHDTGRKSGSHLLASRGSLASLDRWAARERLLAANHWTYDGHQTAYYEVDRTAEEWSVLGPAVLTAAESSSLQSLIAMIRANDAEPVLVIEPLAESRIGDIEGRNKYLRAVGDLARRSGVPLWGLPAMLQDPSLYVDGLHVTREGVAAYTSHIAERLLFATRSESSVAR